MLRALIIDHAGVMTTRLNDSWDIWNAEQGLPPEEWRRVLHDDPEGRRLYADLEHGRISQAEWNTATGALLGLDNTADLMGCAHAHVRPAEPMHALVRAARARGVRVALLSNSYGMHPYDPYAALGVWDLCDVHVISEREGIAKPDPRIYHRCLDLLELPGEACVFVDDTAKNLPPAAALGITTVHATDPATAARKLAAMLRITECSAAV